MYEVASEIVNFSHDFREIPCKLFLTCYGETSKDLEIYCKIVEYFFRFQFLLVLLILRWIESNFPLASGNYFMQPFQRVVFMDSSIDDDYEFNAW